MKPLSAHRIACLWLLLAAPVSLSAQTTTLWMADEAHGHLWSFYDYSQPAANAYDWGELQWFDGSAWQSFPGGTEKNIEGMAVTASGFAYFSVNRTLGSTFEPVLLSVDLAAIPTGASTIQMQTIGTIRTSGGTASPLSVEALALHTASGQLYAVAGETGATTDRLYSIDKNTGIFTDMGAIDGQGESLDHFDGLEFIGNSLFAYDNDDNHLYQLNYSGSGAIISAVTDNDVGDGLGSTDIEGLIYDPDTNRLLAVDNSGQHALHHITLSNGSNSTVSSFVGGGSPIPSDADFEGGVFFARTVPEPSSLLLAGCSAVLAMLRRSRRE